MTRDQLIREFWKVARVGGGTHYSQAAHRLIDLMEGSHMYEPETKPVKRQVRLGFENGECQLYINGVRVLTLKSDHISLAKFTGGTGLKTNIYGHVQTEYEGMT